jgi:hypothetical protein
LRKITKHASGSIVCTANDDGVVVQGKHGLLIFLAPLVASADAVFGIATTHFAGIFLPIWDWVYCFRPWNLISSSSSRAFANPLPPLHHPVFLFLPILDIGVLFIAGISLVSLWVCRMIGRQWVWLQANKIVSINI